MRLQRLREREKRLLSGRSVSPNTAHYTDTVIKNKICGRKKRGQTGGGITS